MFIGLKDSEASAKQFVRRSFQIMENAMDANYAKEIQQETFVYIMNEAYDSGYSYQMRKHTSDVLDRVCQIGERYANSSGTENKSLLDRIEDFFFG